MIRAEFVIEDNKLRGFSLKGHAGSAPAPHDLICASVSAMSLLVINTLREVFRAELDINEIESAPLLEIRLKAVPVQSAESVEGVLKGFQMQLEDLEKQYPKNLSVRTNRMNRKGK